MNFTYEELREIHLALTEGRWLNQNIKDSATKKVESYIMLSKPNTTKADIEASYVYACKMRDGYAMAQVGLQNHPLKMREADKLHTVWWERAEELEKQLTAMEQQT
mgnify:FL=1|tara:strand:- start:254 stop:571 length:318 start_codon:yes stop_codon:yes gene_type:complete